MTDATNNFDPPSTTAATLRIIDANGNRTVEGLRVVEDYLRFGCDDAFLSRMCKQIRHQVSETLAAFQNNRLNARSTETDVGRSNATATEYRRDGLREVAVANLRRACEAMRTLEEYSKIISTSAAKEFETLRYQTYTLEKAIGHLDRARELLDDTSLYVIVDLQFGTQTQFADRIHQLVAAGVDTIQLRDKSANDRQLIEAGRRLRDLLCTPKNSDGELTSSRPLLIINDRPDIACVVRADGVHVGQDEMRVADARSVVGTECLVGVSTHSIEQARQAVLDGADYIGVGPVFESSTKQFEEFVGTDLVQQVSTEIGLPAFAIGGISCNRLPDVMSAGCRRIAVSRAIWHAEDVAVAAQNFRTQLHVSNRD